MASQARHVLNGYKHKLFSVKIQMCFCVTILHARFSSLYLSLQIRKSPGLRDDCSFCKDFRLMYVFA